MKRKIIVVGPQARKRVIDGVHYAAEAAALTYGPYGRNFASGIIGGPIHNSNDGVSLLKELEGRDEIEDIGVRAVREAATRVVNEVGDGTTLATLLTSSILKAIPASETMVGGSKKRPTEIISQIEKECDEVIEQLVDMAEKIETEDQLIHAVEVSVEDHDMAVLIGKAQWKVGVHGSVISEESNSSKDSVEYIHGIRIDNGFPSSRFITNEEKQALDITDVNIILTNHVFHGNFLELKHIFQHIEKMGDRRDIVVMGRGFDDSAIGTALKNIQGGGVRCFPVNAPFMDTNEIMEDLAALVGGKFIDVNQRNLEMMLPGDMGHASKVFIKNLEGIIAGDPTGSDERIDSRVAERVSKIEKRLEGEVSSFERKHLESRLSQLRSGTAVIKVGAETEQQRSRKMDKVDDGIHAARAALQEGVVPGAGVALKMIADKLPEDYIIKQAIQEPYLQVRTLAPAGFVAEDWVKDPVKVVRIALKKACDIASSLATTEIAINWERERPQYVTTVDNKIGRAGDDLA